jgi:hypothetical protein
MLTNLVTRGTQADQALMVGHLNRMALSYVSASVSVSVSVSVIRGW